MKHKNIGSDFDDFLEEEGLLADAEAVAVKRVLAYQIDQHMKEKKISKIISGNPYEGLLLYPYSEEKDLIAEIERFIKKKP